jgi:UDP-N-acetylmuramyl pentapeptide phosphotransferase/UDP-N-acetylglucosamine-1-phosphate transferase
MLGFAPFNRHVARLFLGDAGSLAIGAALGAMLILLARSGHVSAALILPLYYAGDATITLFRRWQRGEKLSQAHRSHYYQLAIQRGYTVPDVTRRIWALNTLLIVLALATIVWNALIVSALALALAAIAVASVLVAFERGRH